MKMLVVLIVIATKPCDARRGPHDAMASCADRKPGEIEMTANGPSDVLVG
jgi:hypothetical protein